MRAFTFFVLGLVFSMGFAGKTAEAAEACLETRPGLLESSLRLEEDIHAFDETLHDAKEAEKIIAIVHHFEEGMMDFIQDLRTGVDCRTAVDVFQHFHEDIQLIYKELDARRDLFYQTPVLNAWNRMLPSYVRFQNRLYRW